MISDVSLFHMLYDFVLQFYNEDEARKYTSK